MSASAEQPPRAGLERSLLEGLGAVCLTVSVDRRPTPPERGLARATLSCSTLSVCANYGVHIGAGLDENAGGFRCDMILHERRFAISRSRVWICSSFQQGLHEL